MERVVGTVELQSMQNILSALSSADFLSLGVQSCSFFSSNNLIHANRACYSICWYSHWNVFALGAIVCFAGGLREQIKASAQLCRVVSCEVNELISKRFL